MSLDISVSRYTLEPRFALNAKVSGTSARHGALISINGGYADLHPWPELGDPTLETLLTKIEAGERHPILERVFYYCRVDELYRRKKLSAFHGLTIPESHLLLTSLDEFQSDTGFKTLKLKIGSDIERELSFIHKRADESYRLRLDANSSFTVTTFNAFWNSLSPKAKDQIEFVEDPVPSTEQIKNISITTKKLASDRECYDGEYTYKIIKPARDDAEAVAVTESSKGRRFIITSSMDHPLGQLSAAWSAALIQRIFPRTLEVCGLLSHAVYSPTLFSRELKIVNGVLIPPLGTGFGFDDILKELEWTKIK